MLNTRISIKRLWVNPVILIAFSKYNFGNANNNNNLTNSNDKDDQTSSPNSNQSVYIHTQNYNREQFKSYEIKVNEALQKRKQREELEAKVNTGEIKPRRQRRIYDKPKFDLNLENYHVWRSWDRMIRKPHPHSVPVVCKIAIAPVLLRKAFGDGYKGLYKVNEDSTMEYMFEDSNFDAFALYDYRATTEYWGQNKKNYDYENQDNIPPRKRKQKYPTFDEFWNSTEEHLFRVNCTEYADWRKFRKWLLEAINKGEKEKSWEDFVQEKLGKFETYDDYDKKYVVPRDMAVFKYTKEFYLFPGEKYEIKTKYHEKLRPSKKLGDEYIKVWQFAEALKKDLTKKAERAAGKKE